MDVWFGAIAAIAGYVAQHWNGLLRCKQNLVDSPNEISEISKHNSSQSVHQTLNEDCPSLGVKIRKKFDENVLLREKELVREDDNMVEMNSTSGIFVTDYSDSPNMVSWPRNINCLRSRNADRRIMKPLTSLENCLVAQLIQERAEMEDCIFGSVPLRPPPYAPQKGIVPQQETIYGVPQLPNIGSSKFQRKERVGKKNQIRIYRGSRKKMTRQRIQSQGFSNEAFLLSLGIYIGVFFSMVAYKKEIEKLNLILKETNYLVHDLQEELEMKGSLIVKEIHTEDYNNDGLHSLSQQNQKTSECCVEEHQWKHTDEEPMSKIEVELEMELERLEQNMDSSHLEGKFMELNELDPEFIPDLPEGELLDQAFNRRGTLHYGDRDEGDKSTPPLANYAVSPRELCLRLHEVIESQLQERVRELETALENSQRKVRYMEEEEYVEEEQMNSCIELSNRPHVWS
ncbi:unnamed protein product [Cuscuta europaea]|uniref:Uncharacterized protein n=1 Tax=Cuscuta europaea TaxID=41803 RepID=A0A9P0YVT7_CUSEU|nr:unnamed protein product [Cuscuta europaea]